MQQSLARRALGIRRELHHSFCRALCRHRTKVESDSGSRRLVDLVRAADYADDELDSSHDERLGSEYRVRGESEGIFREPNRGINTVVNRCISIRINS